MFKGFFHNAMTSRIPMMSFGDVIHGSYVTFYVPEILNQQLHYVYAYTVGI